MIGEACVEPPGDPRPKSALAKSRPTAVDSTTSPRIALKLRRAGERLIPSGSEIRRREDAPRLEQLPPSADAKLSHRVTFARKPISFNGHRLTFLEPQRAPTDAG